jgi:transcriptional regulator with XRE-family HTH domain
MTPDVEVEAVLEALKRALKERGVTYVAVAKALGTSLPTVKRMLNKGAIPLSTLARIAALVDLSIGELADRAGKTRPPITFFDDAQDELFFRRPEMLAYFIRLADGESPQQIERACSLSEASTTAYLLALDRVKLVELLPENRVRVLVKSPCGFSRRSKTLARDLRATVDQVADALFARFHTPGDDMILVTPLRLTTAAYGELRKELREVVERYAALDALETRRRARGTETFVATILCDRHAEKPRPIPDIASRPRTRRAGGR